MEFVSVLELQLTLACPTIKGLLEALAKNVFANGKLKKVLFCY